jgi:RNA polymerase sigma-70 factor, ECF subfamily
LVMETPLSWWPRHDKRAMEDPDSDLIGGIAGGDEAAFEQLVKRYQAPIITFIHRYVGDLYSAQNLAQEVFLRIFQAAPSFESKAKVSSWVFRIAYNLAANELKRRKRMGDFHARISTGALDVLGRPLTNHRAEARNKEMEERLMAALGELPENQRAAFLLKISEGLPYLEISTILDVSVASVESLIFRARSRLKQLVRASPGNPLESNEGS